MCVGRASEREGLDEADTEKEWGVREKEDVRERARRARERGCARERETCQGTH